MVHEIFAPIADTQMAKTCSEIFTGSYHYVQKDDVREQFGTGPEFLTNPDVELLTAQVSYIESIPGGVGLWNPIKFATLRQQLPTKACMLDYYADSVGVFQELAKKQTIVTILDSVPMFSNGGWNAIRNWYCQEVATQGRSLVAAHFLGRAASDRNVLVDALVYPEQIRCGLKTLVRNMFMALPEHEPGFQQIVQDQLADNEQLYGVLGDITASQQLLRSELLRQTMQEYLKQ